MVFQRFLPLRRLLLVSVLVLSTSVFPAVTRGAPTTAAITTEPAPRSAGASAAAAAPPSPTEAHPAEAGSADNLAQGDWWAAVQKNIGRSEYNATPLSDRAGAYQAPNRAHNLRTYFDRSGIRVHDRTAAGSPTLVSLQLAGVGRGARLA